MTITATIRPEFIVEKQGKKFVLAPGLVDAAHRAFETLSIVSEPLLMGTDANGMTWIVSTTVTCPNGTYRQWADASPQNVGRAMLTCLPRLAETRSVSRALRLAVNAGILAIFDDPDEDDDARPANGHAQRDSFEDAFPQNTSPPAPKPAPPPIMPTMTSKTTRRPATSEEIASDYDALVDRAIPLQVPYKSRLDTWAPSYTVQEGQGLRNRIRAAEEAGARSVQQT